MDDATLGSIFARFGIREAQRDAVLADYRNARKAFESFAALDAPHLPNRPSDALQVELARWQVRNFGALWQYDATPHAFLPGSPRKQVLLNILDDATRLNTGAGLYHAESLPAHLDFLSRTFLAHGLPLALYVDYHSFFFTYADKKVRQVSPAVLKGCYVL